ncbi:MAG TPA: phosphate ABC transporter ATP-binding protein PstB [Spirochaetales bacterium]|nr:phosphate ABC transporter ATP-binding protein PstB [Spirochaetales bacterium]HRY53611.1 phosphate ABC transporter ATP-binding protein PstB [Spirochaetia bacterium]HRZ64615.1 phosphate ABC transporter ATP-binding protein PstB [Spirochaetia bacterium]
MPPAVKISVRDLDLWYGSVQALRKVGADIASRSITALIGPSGCGKSTFLRTLNRMNDLIEGVRVEGVVEYEGSSIFAPGADVIELRKRIGMVFQKPNPFPMSVYDNVAYGPRIHGSPSRRAADRRALDEIVERSLEQAALLEEVKDRLHKPALGLSGGQQQRLCIARVLAVEPDVLLMDEPTSALDPISTSKIENLLEELKKRYTIVIVTHNMQQAGRVSDAVGFFLHGELVEYAPTKEVFFNPKDKRTEAYISGRFG